MNIVTDIINALAPAIIDRIASALGISGDQAKKAVAAAVPALLATLGSKAASPAGAGALFDAVSKADPEILGKLTTALTGAKAGKLMEGGSSVLTSLLGDSAFSGLAGAVAKSAGLGGNAGSSLMSLAAPMVLGALAKNGAGLDAKGIAGLLASQQGNIRAALPAGLGSLLSSAGLAGGDFVNQATKAAGDIGKAATSAASTAAKAMPPAKQGSNWLTWAIPAILIAAAAWYFLGRGTPTPPAAPEATTTAPAPAAASLTVDGVDIGQQLTAAMDGIKTSLGSITDVATAQSALPKLQEATTGLDSITGLTAKLSPEQKTALAALISAALPTIKDAATKVLAIQGVGDIAKPVVDGLIGKLEALSKAS